MKKGFSLLELSIVIGIIVFLSMLAMPSFMRFFSKARRSEAYMQLKSLYMAEKAYFAEHGMYTTDLSSTGLGWKIEGTPNYTYGFSGSEGKNYVTGALKTPGSALAGTNASAATFVVGAAGDIDGDGVADYLTIDQDGKVALVVDDLA